MRLPDVDLLVHAVNEVSPEHALASRWMSEGLHSAKGVALAWVAMLAMLAFLRATTRPGISPKPLATDQALALLNGWLLHPAARVVQPRPRHASILGRYLLTAGTAGNLTTDAHLAALAHEHGATVGTFDRDFQRFDRLRVDWLLQP